MCGKVDRDSKVKFSGMTESFDTDDIAIKTKRELRESQSHSAILLATQS